MILLYNPKSNPTGKPILPKALLALGAMIEGRFDYRIIDGNLLDDSGNFAVVWVAPKRNFALLVMTNVAGEGVSERVDEVVWALIQEFLLDP